MNPEQKAPDRTEALPPAGQRGRLKIFLGYAAGVGKTYAMVEAAQQRRLEGVDVVAGYVDTHGNAELEALAAGLAAIPCLQIEVEGVVYPEMDVGAVLARRPQLVLVDDLAHSNAPGSRHTKRYLDVADLLAAGIDVYSTLNIQHLESLNDVVAQITGTVVAETVPDDILETAAEIELIDLPVDELRRRRGEAGQDLFFRPGNLAALRELAFRQAAGHVDDQLRAYMQRHAIAGPWPAAERLLVCVSPSPLSERLVRTARRLAGDLDAEWVALYVETPGQAMLTEVDRARVAHTLRLAETLGARVVTLPGTSVAEAISAYARKHNVTKIIAGRPLRPSWREWLRGSLVDQLIRHSPGIDVYVISSEPAAAPVGADRGAIQWRHGVAGALLVALVTVLALPVRHLVDPTNLVMFYLLAVVIAAVRWERWVAAWVSLLGVLAFDLVFVPPYDTIVVEDAEYLLTFVALFLVGLVISTLSAQARAQAQAALRRENQTTALYEFSRDLAGAGDLAAIAHTVAGHVRRTFGGSAQLWFVQGDRLVAAGGEGDDDQAAAWVFQHRLPAGQGTGTPAGDGRFLLPLLQGERVLGVLSAGFGGEEGGPTHEQRRLLASFANQTALAVERVQLAEQARQAQIWQETERVQSALLNSLSHDLRTPLTSITGALSSLSNDSAFLDETARQDLVETALGEAGRMTRLVNNLLDMQRLASGAATLVREPADVPDLIGVALDQLGNRLDRHVVALDLPDDLPLAPVDFVLMAQVLVNVIENAAKYAPAHSTLEIAAGVEGETVRLAVRDRGPGVPAEALPRVFDKFYRGPAVGGATGSGLGLALSKSIVEAHGGRIWIENRAGGGAAVTIELPLSPAHG